MITIYKNNKEIATVRNFQDVIVYFKNKPIINLVQEGYSIRNTK